MAERARIGTRLQKGLEDTNTKLATVASDMAGVSAWAIIEALGVGERNAAVLVQ